jgi:hypothetical protein
MAKTSLKTKLPVAMADKMAEICCDAVRINAPIILVYLRFLLIHIITQKLFLFCSTASL